MIYFKIDGVNTRPATQEEVIKLLSERKHVAGIEHTLEAFETRLQFIRDTCRHEFREEGIPDVCASCGVRLYE